MSGDLLRRFNKMAAANNDDANNENDPPPMSAVDIQQEFYEAMGDVDWEL